MYNVGLVGAGYIADWHLRALKKIPNVTVVGICDLNLSAANKIAEIYKIPFTTNNLRELTDKDLDVAHVLLPPPAHYEVGKLLINENIHTYFEKPFCTEIDQCQELENTANTHNVRIGIGHNFLFSENYEKLVTDIKKDSLGPISHVNIFWHKKLAQITSGPKNKWLYERPTNTLLEVGSHSIAHIIHLLGETIENLHVNVFSPTNFPPFGSTFRKWLITGSVEKTTFLISIDLNSNTDEHHVEVFGRVGSAKVDYGNNIYLSKKHTKYSMNFDSYNLARRIHRSIRNQATKNIIQYILYKAGFSKRGEPYGDSILNSLCTFYDNIGHSSDLRHSPSFSTHVIDLCHQIGKQTPSSKVTQPPTSSQSIAVKKQCKTVIFGGSGFIGKALVRKLVDSGERIRILCRSPESLPVEFLNESIEIFKGDIRNTKDIEKSIQGMKNVIHLAKPNVNTWKDFYNEDITPLKHLAESCLRSSDCEKLFYCGTIASYNAGSREVTISEKTPYHSKIDRCNLYAKSKAYSEKILTEYNQANNLPVTVFRPGIVVGKGTSPFHLGVGMWRWDSICQFWGQGDTPLPFVLVEDVSVAISLALDRDDVSGQSFNLIGDIRLTAKEYMKELSVYCHSNFTSIPTPIWKFYVLDYLKWLVKKGLNYPDTTQPLYSDWNARSHQSYYDCSETKSALNWTPCDNKQIFIEKGIEEMVYHWFK